MPIIRAQVVTPSDTGLPEDSFVNTFHFDTTSTLALVAQEIVDRLLLFYTNPDDAGSSPLTTYLSTAADWSQTKVRLYDLSQAEPRVPTIIAMPLTVASANKLPNEVSLVLSFHGAQVSGEIAARRRGRVYIGPLNTEGADQGTTGDLGVGSGALRDWASAGETLVNQNDGTTLWVVYSPTGAFATVVVGGWVDNAFDTQRRRGKKASLRTTWPS